jgi:hypothetical protein
MAGHSDDPDAGIVPNGLEHRIIRPNWNPSPAVAVCGFGRCGSTMLMTMLVAGGCPPGNATRPPYEGNVDELYGRHLGGTCIKLLDPDVMARVFAGPTPQWRFVWLDRSPVEQAKSYIKFLTAMAPVTGVRPDTRAVERLAAGYERDRPAILGALRGVGPVLVLDYERILAQPRKTAKLLRREVWPALDVEHAAAVVHERDGKCRPDLAAEVSLIGGQRHG